MKVHIGEEIEKKFQESGLKMPVFAGMLSTGERNVYSIFKRDDISAEMLTKISTALKFNFFSLYERKIPESIVQDSQESYGTAKLISTNISIVGAIDNYSENFSRLLKEINESAVKLGFKLQ